MPAVTIEAKTHILAPDREIDDRERLDGALAGNWGNTVVQTTVEHDLPFEGHGEIGFKPPAERRRMNALLAELHTFLNPERPGNSITPDGEPQST